jgi:hypothetical protein
MLAYQILRCAQNDKRKRVYLIGTVLLSEIRLVAFIYTGVQDPSFLRVTKAKRIYSGIAL